MAKQPKKQQSSIDRLPPEIREELQELLRDPRVTQLAATRKINAILEAEGHEEQLSKSAVNRYDLQMRSIGEKLQQSRETAEMWIGKLGSKPQGQIGNLVNEMLRTLSFDAAIWLQDGEINKENAEGVIDMVNSLALTMQRLEKASNLNVAREKEIRQQALEDAAKKVDKAGQKLGMTPETLKEIHEALLVL
jgi:hypothetical protein